MDQWSHGTVAPTSLRHYPVARLDVYLVSLKVIHLNFFFSLSQSVVLSFLGRFLLNLLGCACQLGFAV